MSDVTVGTRPPEGTKGLGTYSELVAAAIANPGVWVSAPARGTTANTHGQVKNSLAAVCADVRVADGVVYLRWNGA